MKLNTPLTTENQDAVSLDGTRFSITHVNDARGRTLFTVKDRAVAEAIVEAVNAVAGGTPTWHVSHSGLDGDTGFLYADTPEEAIDEAAAWSAARADGEPFILHPGIALPERCFVWRSDADNWAWLPVEVTGAEFDAERAEIIRRREGAADV